jgi:hypothetical protein
VYGCKRKRLLKVAGDLARLLFLRRQPLIAPAPHHPHRHHPFTLPLGIPQTRRVLQGHGYGSLCTVWYALVAASAQRQVRPSRQLHPGTRALKH